MKNTAIVLLALFMGCSDSKTQDTADVWDGVGRIGDYDGGSEVLNIGNDEGSSELASEHDDYACAKVYLQIPYSTRDPETNESSIVLSHQLWSIPVRKSNLLDDDKWYAVPTDFNVDVPVANNVNFDEEEEAYAILILEDGNILYDQVVIPTPDDTWQVCETLYCGQAGCQSHEEFEHESWHCSITQNRLNISGKCPCTFNDVGYPYCDIHYGEEAEE